MARPITIRLVGPLTLAERVEHARMRLHEAAERMWRHPDEPALQVALWARREELMELRLLVAKEDAEAYARKRRRSVRIEDELG